MRFYLFLVFILFGCTPEKSTGRKSQYSYSVQHLISQKGEPQKSEDNIIDDKYQMYQYANETYQVGNNKVIAKYRNPENAEKNIQYWRHFFKNDYYKIVNDSVDHKSLKLSKLFVPKKGITIIFNKTNGIVLRIVESMRDDYVK